ncbi:hypothetical protein DEO72_LG3g1647 [Vigna unguiculata]|uniref:RING-type domain-containing protein n=1 Tax=Vigna unguiculata TaxID=3917 RepID=A0A4D6LFK6_VIGUN|nr:hypothetical protein DEO72_LG3g1647 [Vigna unguiculata]
MLPSQDDLDADAIKRLPFILHQRAAAEESECCICFGTFVDDAKLKVLPGCKYSFHSVCVELEGSREGIHNGFAVQNVRRKRLNPSLLGTFGYFLSLT